jgi:hypothetical protein
MVAANKFVAFNFAFAQKSRLMWAPSLEGAPADCRAHESDIDATS